MQFIEPVPPQLPTAEEQREALQFGLGRVRFWAMSGVLDPSLLLNACLTDLRYDHQCEKGRGAWLWRHIAAMGLQSAFREPILARMADPLDVYEVDQLTHLAYHYVKWGDQAFLAALYNIASTSPDLDEHSRAAQELLTLDRDKALLALAAIRGKRLLSASWSWGDDHFVFLAEEQLGPAQVKEIIRASASPLTHYFLTAWEAEQARRIASRSAETDWPPAPPSLSDLISMAEQGRDAPGLFRRWALKASDDDAQHLAEVLDRAERPDAIACYLSALRFRTLPEFDERMMRYCDHRDERVAYYAHVAISEYRHPLVRQRALAAIGKGLARREMVGLFTKNYEPGDEHAILESLQLPDDLEERHGLLMEVVDMLQGNRDADPLKLGLTVYRHMPCEICRGDAVNVLQNRGCAPTWLKEEFRFDSCKEVDKRTYRSAGA